MNEYAGIEGTPYKPIAYKNPEGPNSPNNPDGNWGKQWPDLGISQQQGGGFEKFLETGLNQSGGRMLDGKKPGKGFHYTQGPFKGMTMDQATAKARQMYAGLSDGVRRKYEGMAAGNDIRSSRERGETSSPSSGVVMRDGKMYSKSLLPPEKPNNGGQSQQQPGNQTQQPQQPTESPTGKGYSALDTPSRPSDAFGTKKDILRPDVAPKPEAPATPAEPVKPEQPTEQPSQSMDGQYAGLEFGRDMSTPTFEGDERIILGEGEAAPEGSTLVGMTNGKRIYERGKGIAAAGQASAESTVAKYQAGRTGTGTPNGMANNMPQYAALEATKRRDQVLSKPNGTNIMGA